MSTTKLTNSQRQLLGRWLRATHLHQEKRQQDVANDLAMARTSVSRLYLGSLERATPIGSLLEPPHARRLS